MTHNAHEGNAYLTLNTSASGCYVGLGAYPYAQPEEPSEASSALACVAALLRELRALDQLPEEYDLDEPGTIPTHDLVLRIHPAFKYLLGDKALSYLSELAPYCGQKGIPLMSVTKVLRPVQEDWRERAATVRRDIHRSGGRSIEEALEAAGDGVVSAPPFPGAVLLPLYLEPAKYAQLCRAGFRRGITASEVAQAAVDHFLKEEEADE